MIEGLVVLAAQFTIIATTLVLGLVYGAVGFSYIVILALSTIVRVVRGGRKTAVSYARPEIAHMKALVNN